MAEVWRHQVDRWGVTYKLEVATDGSGLRLLLYFPSVGAWLEYPLEDDAAHDLLNQLESWRAGWFRREPASP